MSDKQTDRRTDGRTGDVRKVSYDAGGIFFQLDANTTVENFSAQRQPTFSQPTNVTPFDFTTTGS